MSEKPKHTPGPWVVMPLDGRKYYGTTVELSDGSHIQIWGSRIWLPSERELATWGPKPDDEAEREWLSNIMCDGHYEDARDLANACAIAAVPELIAALAPFASFADAWDRNPIRGLSNELYTIHSGEAEASFRLSDCRAARAALAKAGVK